MGGIGSGRHWSYGIKNTTSDYPRIDVRRWHREGLLTLHQRFRWDWLCNGKNIASIHVCSEPGRVILTYRHQKVGGEWKEQNYPINLDWTACHYGGERPWFLCPINGCGRRVAILHSAGIFACRHCHQLAYSSQRETFDDRAARRANKIREKLGWKLGILNSNGYKPKGMHWSTFERLTTQHDSFRSITLAGIVAQLNYSKFVV